MGRVSVSEQDQAPYHGELIHPPTLPLGDQANVMARLRSALDDNGNPTAREGSLLAIKGLLASVGRAAEPYVVPLIPTILDRAADKVAPVRCALKGMRGEEEPLHTFYDRG